jgi:ubiquinone/menaquinone biosynthesis C-methylase UbiE
MFFPDKIRANQEARRVLRTNGHYLLVTFNRLELNPIAKAVEDAVSALLPTIHLTTWSVAPSVLRSGAD